VSRHPTAGYSDEKLANRPDHQEQPDGVADESRYTNQQPGGQHDHAIEHFPAGKIAPGKSLLGAAQHAQADPLDQEWARGAHADEEQHGPAEPNVLGYRHEGGDLCDEEETGSEQDHLFRVSPEPG
jgi:hypothetical protein